ncbi:MAG: substrate-binding domain-containing protein [Candidatus Hadarchaeia archaeon]
MNWKVALPGLILLLVLAGSIVVKEESEITLYGRRSSSGTYLYFRNNVLQGGYSGDMYNMIGNEAIVQAVANDKTAIGYVGVGYVLNEEDEPVDGIKILNISPDENSDPVTPLDPQNVKTGEYPIARPLYQYTNGVPSKQSLVEDFLSFELSERGGDILIETGFYPMTPQDSSHNENLFDNGESSDSDVGNDLIIKGSDTILQLTSNFAEAYKNQDSDVNITVEGGGSGTGITSLIEGRADVANSSREIDPAEIEEARRNDINPTGFILGRDGLCIIVNEENPINSLTVEQVSRVFQGEVETWEELDW